MNRFEMEVMLGKKYGNTIGFIANVINTSHARPAAKIKKLAELAEFNRITTMSFDIDNVLVDGSAFRLGKLETYTKPMPEGWLDD